MPATGLSGTLAAIAQFSALGATVLLTIAVHALVMAAVIGVSRHHGPWSGGSIPVLFRVTASVALVLMAAHLAEVFIWAATYKLLGVTSENADDLYLAFVNYTTLGYGDVLPVPTWRLIGPLTAMNGIILFGWSTAVIFEVVRRTLVQLEKIPPA